MVDFTKILGTDKIKVQIDPIEIFKSLDKESGKEYLRPSQEVALNNWYTHFRNQKDIIIKLHTGQGKTLIGLLILNSFLNEKKGPALYICPNKFLVNQTMIQAKEFGIKTVAIDDRNNLPTSFLNSNEILITTCKKLFNGKSIFGVKGSTKDKINIGAIVIDDAHKCLDIICQSFSVIINRIEGGEENRLYRELFNLFEDSLSSQASGTLLDINEGDDKYIVVPFWNWSENYTKVLNLFKSYKSQDEVFFTWDFINDTIQDCFCIISGRKIEISPRIIPIYKIPSFSEANKRIFLSATLTEDAFLIRDLGIDSEAILNPIIHEGVKYSGERMVILPKLVDPYISRLDLIRGLSEFLEKFKDFGIFSIVPSFYHAKNWSELNCKVLYSNDIHKNLIVLKKKIEDKGVNEIIIIVNEYDGIDLPDQTCRILILDNTPHYLSLFDRYKKDIMPDSDILQRNIAQRIEQGMGRGIRGSSDWCIVILLGDDLTKFVSIDKNRSYFSNEVQRQIQISEELSEIMKVEGTGWSVVRKLIMQCLQRDQGWKEYYRTRMNNLSLKPPSKSYIKRFQMEREAELLYSSKQYDKAIEKIRSLIDVFSLTSLEKGWYIQLLSIYTYPFDKSGAMELQLNAYSMNRDLSAPIAGITYTKLSAQNNRRDDNILSWIKSHNSFNDILIDLDSILDKLNFGIEANSFEEGFALLGTVIGFQSQRPEKKFKKGPDILWNLNEKEFWIIECKNEVDPSRDFISKNETGQIGNSYGWFKANYSEYTGIPIIIHPSCELNDDAYFQGELFCIKKDGLKELNNRIRNFYNSFRTIELTNLSKEQINTKINEYKLNIPQLKSEILIKVKRKKKMK